MKADAEGGWPEWEGGLKKWRGFCWDGSERKRDEEEGKGCSKWILRDHLLHGDHTVWSGDLSLRKRLQGRKRRKSARLSKKIYSA